MVVNSITKSHILIVAPYSTLPGEPHVNRFSHLAVALAQHGHRVTFVTSRFSHSSKTHRSGPTVATHDGITVVLIDEPGYEKNVGYGRLRSIRTFTANFSGRFGSFDDFDLVYSAFPLISTNIYILKTLNRNRTKFVVDIQDVWPEAISAAFPLARYLPNKLLPFNKSANRVYRGADAIVAVSQTYLNRGLSVNSDAPGLLAYLGSEFKIRTTAPDPSNKIKLFYIGTISYSYDIETIMCAVAELRSCGVAVEFHIYGDGPHRKGLMDKQLDGSTFHGSVPYCELDDALRSKHVAVNCIKAYAPQSITNKLCDYMIWGGAVLNSQELPEVRSLLGRVPHANYKAGSVSSACDAILCLLASGQLFEERTSLAEFSRDVSTSRIIFFVERLLTGNAR